MAWTAYCRKCGKDVPPGDVCPFCGGKLTKASLRIAWCVRRRPAADWLCWNAAARILLPVWALSLLLILLPEAILRGGAGVSALLTGGLLSTMGTLLAVAAVLTLIILLAQGEDILDCVADSRGVHVRLYLPEPTALKLLARFRTPALRSRADASGTVPVVLIAEKDLAWKDVARVQLWPEKLIILFYAPRWWQRAALPCTPFTWTDCQELIREKLGKKKKVILPPSLRAAKEKSAADFPAGPIQYSENTENL